MPFTPIPGAARLRVNFTYAGHPGVNVLHASFPGGGDFDEMSNLAVAAVEAYQSQILPGKHPQFVLDSITATDLTTATGTEVTSVSGEPGLNDGTPASAALSAVVRQITALRGRRFRGRIFDCGYAIDELGSSAGVLPADFRGALISAWLNFRANLNTAGFALVVVSLVAASYQVVSDLDTAPIVGVQRRRLRD
jgi:hypothetical protein